MVRRREARVRTVLPVRVFGMDSSGKPFTALAHTLDITNSGARLGGVQHSLKIGDIVGVQRGTDKARFRIAWIGSVENHNAGQVGLECAQQNKNIWNIIFEESPPDTFDISKLDPPRPSTPAPPQSSERRDFIRYPCDIGLDMQVEGSDVSIFARCTDISRGGCYVETRSPLLPKVRLFLCLKTNALRVRALAEVRSSHPSMGMGLHFEQLGDDDLRYLLQILDEFEAKRPADLGSGILARLQEGVQSLQRLQDDLARYMLNPQALRTLQTSTSISRKALDCCRRTLQEHATPELLNQALFAERLKTLHTLVEELESDHPATPVSPSQLRALRSVTESLLEKLPAESTAPAFDVPFTFTNARLM